MIQHPHKNCFSEHLADEEFLKVYGLLGGKLDQKIRKYLGDYSPNITNIRTNQIKITEDCTSTQLTLGG